MSSGCVSARMSEDEDRKKTAMVPPRLTLVPTTRDADDASPTEAGEAPLAASPTANLAARIEALSLADRREKLRILEAVLFASSEPQDEKRLASHIADTDEIVPLLEELQAIYAGRGVALVRVTDKWMFRTAEDLSYLLERYSSEQRRLSRAALETLAIIAYHQPVTRAEIEEVRGVTTSKGTLDVLLETGWIRPRGRRRAPGKPVTYGTTDTFLTHFGLDKIADLPGLAELKGAGLLDGTLPAGFTVPSPTDVAALMPDELPLDSADDEDEEQAQLDIDAPDEASDDPENGPPTA